MSDPFDPNRETRAEYDERIRREAEDDFGYHDCDEPVGSCDWCGSNIYDDDCDGLCDQCAWHAGQGDGCDDVGGSGVM